MDNIPDNNHRRVLIVGAGEIGQQIAYQLEKCQDDPCLVVGFAEDDPALVSFSKLRILGGKDQILEIVQKFKIDEVIISELPSWQQKLADSILSNGNRNLTVKMVPGVFETMFIKPKFNQIDDVPLVGFPEPGIKKSHLILKRVMDLIVSGIALILVSPLMLISVILIKATSKGPVIYAQERVGQGGCIFKVLKLRTMISGAEDKTGPTLSKPGDPRITRVGRFLRATKLDEFPQFINVIRGEMSVVGPRPERPVFVNKFLKQIPSYRERLSVRPGITGLAQVHGYYQTPVYTKIRYDLLYIYNQSFLLDLRIILMTLAAVLKRKS